MICAAFCVNKQVHRILNKNTFSRSLDAVNYELVLMLRGMSLDYTRADYDGRDTSVSHNSWYLSRLEPSTSWLRAKWCAQ